MRKDASSLMRRSFYSSWSWRTWRKSTDAAMLNCRTWRQKSSTASTWWTGAGTNSSQVLAHQGSFWAASSRVGLLKSISAQSRGLKLDDHWVLFNPGHPMILDIFQEIAWVYTSCTILCVTYQQIAFCLKIVWFQWNEVCKLCKQTKELFFLIELNINL